MKLKKISFEKVPKNFPVWKSEKDYLSFPNNPLYWRDWGEKRPKYVSIKNKDHYQLTCLLSKILF